MFTNPDIYGFILVYVNKMKAGYDETEVVRAFCGFASDFYKTEVYAFKNVNISTYLYMFTYFER
jgi:hypothetical protein